MTLNQPKGPLTWILSPFFIETKAFLVALLIFSDLVPMNISDSSLTEATENASHFLPLFF